MGMYGHLRSISPAELQLAQTSPKKFYEQLLGNEQDLKRVDEFVIREGKALQKRYEDSGLFVRMRETFARNGKLQPEDAEALRKYNEEYASLAATIRTVRPRSLPEPQEVDLHKSWHCLHFLFTGRTEGGNGPLAQVILGGHEIPDRGRLPYGPARYLTPEETRQVLEALNLFPAEQATRNFDPKRAAAEQIYCPDHEPDELMGYFEKVELCYGHAVDNGNGMLLLIT